MLNKIVAHITCDKCGSKFTAGIPECASTEQHQTLFDVVTEHLDEIEGSVPVIENAGFHEGEFYCSTCWAPKEEQLFIEDIKAGRVRKEHLEGLDEKYLVCLPELA